MPHSGVFEAAHAARNGILQPEELNSEGTYSLRASVPSPVMNVLCVNMNEEELKPIVYDAWNDYEVVNMTTWNEAWLQQNATTRNTTVVDEIFGWKNDTRVNYPPVFPKYPKQFNTVMNHTSYPWGRPAIYLLGQGGSDSGSNMTGIYSVCKIDVSITPGCSTQYNARSGGGSMEAYCEDRADNMQYIKHNPDAQWKISLANWKDIGFDWSNSLSLQTGLVDGEASNSRLLTQLMLNPTNTDPDNFQADLSPALPSMGEALAVMSGCTLLKSMMDAPFVMFWVSEPSQHARASSSKHRWRCLARATRILLTHPRITLPQCSTTTNPNSLTPLSKPSNTPQAALKTLPPAPGSSSSCSSS
jgi:hypothetical protein